MQLAERLCSNVSHAAVSRAPSLVDELGLGARNTMSVQRLMKTVGRSSGLGIALKSMLQTPRWWSAWQTSAVDCGLSRKVCKLDEIDLEMIGVSGNELRL